MNHRDAEKQIPQLDDVELIRLLTQNAKDQNPEMLALAKAEANRRGLPIDEGFIPSVDDRDMSGGTEAFPSRRFAAGGVPIRCTHCGNDHFEASEILLNTRGLTFLKLDWLNRSATALVCAQCARIQLFAATPDTIDDHE
jgi:predicted nucleic-acid-binding Zn-ribbon protein